MQGKTILLIDDDDISNILNQMVISIADPDVKLIVFSNAVDALQHLKSNPPPDHILLDINMPIMNGWQFAQKCSELIPSLEIIVLSSSDDENDLNKMKEFNNIRKYVIKPMSVESYIGLGI